MAAGLSRREVLQVLGVLGFSAAGCGLLRAPSPGDAPELDDPPLDPGPPPPPARYGSNLRALMETLLAGSPAAGAERVLSIESFVFIARAQGLLPGVPLDFSAPATFDESFHRILDADLNALAALERPLTAFRELPPELREAAVQAAFDDPLRAPSLLFVRAACFIAYLGAVYSDLGLVAIGFPPFEDFEDRLAVSGYPRTRASGEVEDYTYNRDPAPTPGDDLSLVIDANGDLI